METIENIRDKTRSIMRDVSLLEDEYIALDTFVWGDVRMGTVDRNNTLEIMGICMKVAEILIELDDALLSIERWESDFGHRIRRLMNNKR